MQSIGFHEFRGDMIGRRAQNFVAQGDRFVEAPQSREREGRAVAGRDITGIERPSMLEGSQREPRFVERGQGNRAIVPRHFVARRQRDEAIVVDDGLAVPTHHV